MSAKVVYTLPLYTYSCILVFVGKTYESDFGAWLYLVRCLFIKIPTIFVWKSGHCRSRAEWAGGSWPPARARASNTFLFCVCAAHGYHMVYTNAPHTPPGYFCFVVGQTRENNIVPKNYAFVYKRSIRSVLLLCSENVNRPFECCKFLLLT